MAKDKTPAPTPEPPPPAQGGAFERLDDGSLKPIEESAERAKPQTTSEE